MTKFEVGKEYVGDNGMRIRVIAANDWGAAFEHLSDGYVGQYGHSSHRGHCWRPAPRTVERWIVEYSDGYATHAARAEVDAHVDYLRSRGILAIANGPFPCVAP